MKTMIFTIAMMVFGVLSFGKTNEKAVAQMANTQSIYSTDEIVTGYLKIKHDLVKSDSKASALDGETLVVSLSTIEVSQLTTAQKAVLAKMVIEIKGQAKTIASTSGKLDKQRKAFRQLSIAVNELVTTFGSSKKLYVDFCPMYEEGSVWISESKEIKNPYYGAQMLTCGRIKETIE